MNTSSNNPVLEGSTLYYALLYLDPDAAKRIADTLQFIHAISHALHDVSEPQVAEKKIHWWHEELARLAKQSARHPDCIAVQPFLHHVLDVKASLKLLSTTSNERFTPYNNDQSLQQGIQDDFGARLQLLDSALGANSNVQTREAIALGLGYFERLDELVVLLRNSYTAFSDERYAKYSVKPEQLLAYSNKAISSDTADSEMADDNTAQLLAEAVKETIDALENALLQIESELSPVSLPIQIICRIRLAQVKLWRKRKPDLLRESMKLTPLRKFIITYRCKRQFTKSAKLAS